MVGGGVTFAAGFVCGLFWVVLLQFLLISFLLFRLLRKRSSSQESPLSFHAHLSTDSSRLISPSFQGDIWVAAIPLESENGAKGKDIGKQDSIKDGPGVHPLKMHASIKGNVLFLADENGIKKQISLEGCEIHSISGTQESSRKWAKKYPIKLQNRNHFLLDGSHVCLLYIGTSWEKETWCQILRAASRMDNTTHQDFYKVNRDLFKSYIAELNNSYPSLFGFGSGRRNYSQNEKGKVRKLGAGLFKKRQAWKRFIKKSSAESNTTGLHGSKSSVSLHSQDEAALQLKGEDLGSSGSLGFDSDGVSSNKLSVSERIKDDCYDALKMDDKAFQSEKGSISESNKVLIEGMPSGSAYMPLDQGSMCWNILLSRLYFDFYRSSRIKEAIQRKIQIQLSRVSTPSFIRHIKIKNLDLGERPPIILSMNALPVTTDEFWAFQADLEYSGDASLTIETSLDIRDTNSQEKMITQSMEPTLAGEVTADLLAEGFQSVGGDLNIGTDIRNSVETSEAPSNKTGYLKNIRFSSSRTWIQSKTSLKSMLSNIAERFSQVPLTLSLRLVSLKGRLLFRIKSSPSDRIWFSFEGMPEIELLTEPTIGDHKISTSPVLDLIKNRIKMAMNDILVSPNSESIEIPWMISETDDWLPQTDVPFPWSPLERASQDSDDTELAQPDHDSEGSAHMPYQIAYQAAEGSNHSSLEKPLLEKDDRSIPPQETLFSSDSESSFRRDVESEDVSDSSKKPLGWKRAKVMEIGKKMGDKLKEKKRNILDRMREGNEESSHVK